MSSARRVTPRIVISTLLLVLSVTSAGLLAFSATSTGVTVGPFDATHPTPHSSAAGGPRLSTIDGCTTITTSGTYRLTADVVDSTEQVCILIRADDVRLDGGDNVIDGSPVVLDWRQKLLGGTDYNSGIGVAVASGHRLTNVTVTNLSVTEWEAGVAFENVSGGHVRNVSAARNDEGIVLQNVTDATVRGTTVLDNEEDGLALFRTERVEIRDVEARANHFAGVAVLDSTGVAIVDTTAIENDGDGVVLVNGTRHRLTDVTAAENAVGILLLSTNDTTVSHSTGDSNSFAGILLARSSNNTLVENAVVNTTGRNRVFTAPAGIILFEAGDNRIVETVARRNRPWTVFARNGSSGNRVENLTFATATVSVRGRNVALRPASLPPSAPSGVTPDAPRVNVTGTGSDARFELELQYDPTDLAGDDDRSAYLWQYEDGDWSPTNATVDPTRNAVIVSLDPGPVENVSIVLGTRNETPTIGGNGTVGEW